MDRKMIVCGACHKAGVPAPVFVEEDGKRINCVEERCTKCGQLWQFPNYPPAKVTSQGGREE